MSYILLANTVDGWLDG